MSLPNSNSEKVSYKEHWLYVHELIALLEELEPDDWVVPNKVANLSVHRVGYTNRYIGSNMLGYIDFLTGELEIDTDD